MQAEEKSSVKPPMLSVGLAVFEGERYLSQAIDSILAQTFRDFELIICDNASTDDTQEICQRYASKDARVKYFRNAENIGGANNGNKTFHLSAGKYFKFAAHDDMCAPDLFAKCIAVLEQDPSVVLCHSMVTEIDEYGNILNVIERHKGGSEKPHERFRNLTRLDYNCEEIYGIIRAEIMQKTDLVRNYTDADRTFICQLALFGRFYQVPEPLFYKRNHPAMSTKVYSGWRDRMAWFDERFRDRVTLPHWMQFFHYLKIIAQAPLKPAERMMCYLHMIRWLGSDGYRIIDGHGGRMLSDLIHAARFLIARRFKSRNPT